MRRTINFLFNLGDEIKEKRLSIGFLIDLSGSMQGKPLYNLKNALLQMLKPLVQFNTQTNQRNYVPADELMLMVFAAKVQKVCPWVNQNDYDFFKELLLSIPESIFGSSGTTALYDGIYEIFNEFKKTKKDNEKILIVFSDGGENGSSRTKEEVIKTINKFKQGFLTSSQYELLQQRTSSDVLKSLFDEEDDDYVFKMDFLDLIMNINIEDSIKQEIINYRKNSIIDVKIYCLFYEGEGYETNINLLQEFSSLTGGSVYKSPTDEQIPIIFNEMILDIIYENKPSIRTKLSKRLSEVSNLPWYKIISFNSVNEDEEHCSFQKNYSNPIYYMNINNLVSNNSKRTDYLNLFKNFFESDKIYSDFKNCIQDQSRNLLGHNIENDLNLLLVFRGNDKLAISSVKYLAKKIRSDIGSLIDPATNVWTAIVILLEKYKDYSVQENAELYAFLNEINKTEIDEVHSIYLISDFNKYAHNNNSGFSYLEKHQFEDLATEIVFDLNFNQNLFNKLISGTSSNESSRFIAIGGTSAYLNKNEYKNALTNILTANFLTNLFNDERLPVDENFIKRKINEFLEQINYNNISSRLIECQPQTENLFQQLSCPSLNEFLTFKKQVELKLFNKQDPRQEKVSITRNYLNFIDYITLLYFDILEYIDSCHSLEFFEAELDRRFDGLVKEYFLKLQQFVNNVFYENSSGSSPLAAYKFTERLNDEITRFIQSELENHFSSDPIKQEIDQWSFTNSAGVKVPPGNPAEDLNELKRQIENFPLPWSIRIKSGVFGILLAGIIFSILLLVGNNQILSTVIALFLIVFSIIIGEFIIKRKTKQLQNIIRKYENSHKYITWKKAFRIYCEKLKNFYAFLKDKVKRNSISEINPYLINNYSEQELIEIFDEACTKTLSYFILREDEKELDSNIFHISLRPYLFEKIKTFDSTSEHFIRIKPDIISEMQILGLDLNVIGDYVRLLNTILNTLVTLRTKEFPAVVIGPIPLNFENLSPGLHSKIELIPIIKNKEYLLILLQDLSENEKNELLNIWNDDYWKKSIERLLQLRMQVQLIKNKNLFYLWRDIVRYEIWLKKIKELIKKSTSADENLESKFNFDNVFYSWKDMYSSRKQFKEGLFKVFFKLADNIVDVSFDIWKIIIGLKNDTNIYYLLNGNSYPALSVIASNISDYPRVENYYSANEKLSIDTLINRGIRLEDKFPAKSTTNDWNFIRLSLDNDQIYFNKVYYLDLRNCEKYSIFKVIFESLKKYFNVNDYSEVFSKMKSDSNFLKNLFLEGFYSSYLNNHNKNFNFIGEESGEEMNL
jgi:hypothetical protein